jgi:hypothetical protein
VDKYGNHLYLLCDDVLVEVLKCNLPFYQHNDLCFFPLCFHDGLQKLAEELEVIPLGLFLILP